MKVVPESASQMMKNNQEKQDPQKINQNLFTPIVGVRVVCTGGIDNKQSQPGNFWAANNLATFNFT